MNEPTNQDLTALDEDLVAYLDGELDAEASRRLEVKLQQDAELRERVRQHQRAWELLDQLPRAEVDEQFTETTVEMVVMSAASEVEQAKHGDALYERLTWALAAILVVVAGCFGYVLTSAVLSQPNRQLVEDLPVIEHLDAYRNIDDIDFLRSLESTGLFGEEIDDEL